MLIQESQSRKQLQLQQQVTNRTIVLVSAHKYAHFHQLILPILLHNTTTTTTTTTTTATTTTWWRK